MSASGSIAARRRIFAGLSMVAIVAAITVTTSPSASADTGPATPLAYVTTQADSPDLAIVDTTSATKAGALPTNLSHDVVLSPDGKYAYVAENVTDANSDLAVVSTASPRAVLKRIPTFGRNPQSVVAINPAGDRVYVGAGGDLTVIDTTDPTIPTFVKHLTNVRSDNGILVSPDGSTLYAAGRSGGISVFNARSNEFLKSIEVPDPVTNRTVFGMALSPDGKTLYVSKLNPSAQGDLPGVDVISTEAVLSTEGV
jgi:DNA-binding beta-propeller fold protein YncE